MTSTNNEEEGSKRMQIMENRTMSTPTEWPPLSDVIPKEPEEGAYQTRREYTCDPGS